MTAPTFTVGAYVLGAPNSPRALVRHEGLLTAYADGAMAERDETREAYLSHFAFGPDLQPYYRANRGSVRGYEGPCWCRRPVLDIDREDLSDALADARRLVAFLHDRYPEAEGDVPVWFSGRRGFHVGVELAHGPPPAADFNRVCRTLCEALAARAGVTIDTSVYDLAHLIRLPNTRHPKTGLFKRRIDADALFRLDAAGVLELARHPAGDGIPAVRSCPAALADDWREAERVTARAAEARAADRTAHGLAPDARAPRYFLDFLRFADVGESRHLTLFRCAAWLTEQGAPPSLCSALLTEPGLDLALKPQDVERQIGCGIAHANRQRGAAGDPRPDPEADPDAFERWAVRHESDPLPAGGLDFPFGLLTPAGGGGGPA